MKLSAQQRIKLALGITRIAESLLWSTRRRIADPLIIQFQDLMALRFERQESFWFRRAWPLVSKLFTEADRVPPDANRAADKLDDYKDPAADLRALRAALGGAVVGGAQVAAVDMKVALGFSLRSERVQKYLDTRSVATIGADVDRVTKEKLRRLLSRAYAESWTHTRTIREVKQLWAGFRLPSRVSFISSRAELIAVTEIGQAFSHGSIEFAREIQAQGNRVEKAWALAANPCPICQPNGSQGWIPLNRPFSSGHDRPLAHPACRCSLLTRIVEA